jgi:hypothetical protein
VGTVDNQDAEDMSYDITWEEGKQYWYDIVYEIGRDPNGKSKAITMIDHSGHADSFVVPVNASHQKIIDLWRTVIEAPPNVTIFISAWHDTIFHWGYSSAESTASYQLETPTMRWNVAIFPGQTQFEADQITRLLEIKTPPLVRSQRINRHSLAIIQFSEEPQRLNTRLIGTHLFSWNLEGTIIRDIAPMDLWVPYDLGQIMRRGHGLNTSIPEEVDMAEFPDYPWDSEVMIRIKSQNPPPHATIPIPSSGPQGTIAPPDSWQGPALGQAPPISADAAGLIDHTSPNTGQDGTTLGDLPPDPNMQAFRGLLDIDAAVHKMISWTTRKNDPLMLGISLPINDESLQRAHEAQLWEQVIDDAIIENNHAEMMFQWLLQKLIYRSESDHQRPYGMPEEVSEVTVQTWKDGKAGYILFTPKGMIADSMASMETRIMIEYDGGYMREGIGNAYTIQMIYDDFMFLTGNTWKIYPALAYRRLNDGTIVHNCVSDFQESQLIRSEHTQLEHPPRIIEDRGRGSEILSPEDQGKLMQYWAWSQLPLDVGVIFPTRDHRTYEFWFETRLQPMPEDNDNFFYFRVVKEI